MTPTNHCHLTNPQGCPKCGRKHMIHIQRSNSEDFIEKAKNIHNDKYDYFKTEYVNNTTKVIITCPIHGDFEQTPSNHLITKDALNVVK